VFNLGNALVRAAEEAPERGQLLLDAVAAYEEALRLDPADQDAKWNLEIALQRLEEDRMAGGSSGRGRAADYGRGNMNVPGYEGNPDAASGAMAGGGYGAGEGESVEELDADQARHCWRRSSASNWPATRGGAARRDRRETATGDSLSVRRPLRHPAGLGTLALTIELVVICGLLQPR
jgi:hypothetical protein